MSNCPVCERSFGIKRWKHTCTVCRRTVCDDCAPASKSDHKKDLVRICSMCVSSGRRLGNTTDTPSGGSLGTDGNGQAARPQQQLDAQSEAERERRAAAIEARMRATQPRGAPARSSPAIAKPTSPAISRAPPEMSQGAASGAVGTPTASSVAVDGHSTASPSSPSPPSAGSNPALEAALRRQQQQREQQGARPGPQLSEEKQRLLRQIDTLLEANRETAPFGLRSADEGKLKSYLAYLKNKYAAA